MANVEHSALTGTALHEPKGVATASSGTAYISNGTGSGVWQPIHRHLGVTSGFNKSAPYSYSLSTDITSKFLSPTVSIASSLGFTVLTTPNLRFKYDSSTDIHCLLGLTMSSSQATGPSRDVEWSLFKNGSEITGSRTIRSINTGSWGSITVTGIVQLFQNDYVEIKTNASVDATVVDYASIYFSIVGMSA